MHITECKTNHMTNPLGFQMNRVYLSYQVEEAEGKKQKAARILIALDSSMTSIVYDSGMSKEVRSIGTKIPLRNAATKSTDAEEDQQRNAAETSRENALVLAPCTRYYWTVTVESDLGETAVSEVNWFETAKIEESWKGQWIACDKKDRHPIFHKDLIKAAPGVADGKEIASARLYICGLGLYEAYLNGRKIGEELLAPGCNNYQKWLQYQTYDITEELKAGGELSVMMGDGWYLGRFGFYSGLVKEEKDNSYQLLAEVQVTYADGNCDVIGTDESWSVTRSNITFSSIYDGEQVDDTLEETAQEEVYVLPEKSGLTARYSLPVTEHEKFNGQLIDSTEDELVMDFGQNMSGIFYLHVHEPKGTKIHLQFGEVLQGGHFYRDNLRSALAEYWYTSDGKEHVLRPHFTFYGFRYVKVNGITDFKPEDLYVRAIYSDVEDTGRMTTGHAKVNRLIENVRWGERSNFVDVPTDCPQRDERMGWTGDAQVFSSTAMFLSDSYAFYRKFLHDMETEQETHGGMVPDVIPSFGVGSFSSVWGDAACIIPWNMYLAYGDTGILEEQYESMKAWVEFIRQIDGEDHGWRRLFSYADWVALDSRVREKDTVLGGTDDAYVSDIYYWNSLCIVARAAELLGKAEEAAEYSVLADRILEDLRAEYFSRTGRCCCDTQTAQVLALEYGVATNPKLTADMLRTALIRSKGKLQTGFTGTPFLCKVLCENGMEAMAYDLLLNEECPGWLYEVNHGATTIWERWNSVEEDGSMSSTGMNSLNHYAYGSILNWLVRYVGGIRPLTVGYTKVQIAPAVDLRLGSAEVSYRSIAGTYSVSWKITNTRTITIRFEVPFGCEAELLLPQLSAAGREQLLQMDGITQIEAVTESGTELGTGMGREALKNPIGGVKNVCCQEVGEPKKMSGVLIADPGSYEITYEAEKPFTKVYTTEDEVGELQVHPDVVKVIDRFIPDFANMDLAYRMRSLRDVVLHRTGDLYRDRQVNAAGITSKEQLAEIDQALAKMYR